MRSWHTDNPAGASLLLIVTAVRLRFCRFRSNATKVSTPISHGGSGIMNCPIAIGSTKNLQQSFYVYRSGVKPALRSCSRDSLCWVAIFGRICLRALFPRTPIHRSLLGLSGGSAFCAPELRSLGARNRRQYRALYVMSAHPFTNCVFRRNSENQAACFVYGACWRFDWDRGDVQAGSGRELVLAGCSLSSFCAPREAMERGSFIHRLVGHGPAQPCWRWSSFTFGGVVD